MKKIAKTQNDSEMLDEYEFTTGVRGKYNKRYSEGTNIVVLSPDIAEIFPDSKSVNDALRELTKLQSARQKNKVVV